MEWLIFIVSLGTILAVGEFRDWLHRYKRSKEVMKMKPLLPSAWSKDVMSYYKHNPTRRTLY